MGDLFKDILSDEESLFRDEIALDFDYIPYPMKYRENEQQYIARCIKPLLEGREGKNLLIFGRQGIGKTLSMKHVIDELNKETDDIITLLINCWKKDTFHKIMMDICEQIGYKWGFNKKTDEVFKEVSKILNKRKVVFCFDEIDKLKDEQVLYSILEDIGKKSIFLITNEKNFLSKIDARVCSRLMADTLEFRPYDSDETRGILEQRKEFAFVPGVWESAAFELVVDKTSEFEDIRTGLFLMKESGSNAEIEASRKIILKHSENAVSKLDNYKVKDDLSNEEGKIMELIRLNPGKTSLEIYEMYNKEYGRSLRHFQRKIKDLEKIGNISVSEKVSDYGGKIYVLDVGVKKLGDF